MLKGSLTGVRVLDLSRVLAGPYCAMLLGDAGADVIKVESPSGDDTRTWGPPYLPGCDPRPDYPGDSAYYVAFNRNKRGIAADLRTPEGQELVRRLAAQADILIENFKPGTMERWGLGYEDVLAPANPRLVYVNISGFGRTGPYKDLPGYDFVAQAMGGLMSINGDPAGEPMKVGVPIADLTTGMLAAFAATTALYHARATGQGQRVDLSLFETQVAWLGNVASNYLVSGKTPARYGNAHSNVAPYQLFYTADRPLVVAVGNDGQFRRFAELLGHPEWAQDPRFATNPGRVRNRPQLAELVQGELRRRPAAEWIAALQGAGIPCGPVQTVPAVFADPQVAAREMVVRVEHPDAGEVRLVGVPFKFSATPAGVRRVPPRLGEHTVEVLEELGYSPKEIERLKGTGVVRAL